MAISCIWDSLLNSRGGGGDGSGGGGGDVLKSMVCTGLWFCWHFHRDLSPFFKAQFPLQIEGILCLAGCHPVAQTQDYQLVCIWGSLVKFQGGKDVLKFDVLPQWDAAFCEVCIQAKGHSVANLPSQQKLKLAVVQDCIWETSGYEKWGELGKWPCNQWR